jgi:hypothetical protein
VIRIDVYTVFAVGEVRVTIRADKAGLVEHGLARFEPKANQWLYAATTENSEQDDWSIAATAVGVGGTRNRGRSRFARCLRLLNRR